MKHYYKLFNNIISFENLYIAAKKASRGKKDRSDVSLFLLELEPNLLQLHNELLNGKYFPGKLRHFTIHDPKKREISIAPFRDRVVHHAICNIIEPYFERIYIFDSYACRVGKGTHRAVHRAQHFIRKYDYCLKLDVRQFFASIDHNILINILEKMFSDSRLLELTGQIIRNGGSNGKGLPIGNLTSQHFANLYLDRLDHYIKDELGVKGYLRYMDDFLIFSDSKSVLHSCYDDTKTFLWDNLDLELKGSATRLAPITEGIHFLGLRIFPDIIRFDNRTKRRRWKNVRQATKNMTIGNTSENNFQESMQSITEHLRLADAYQLRRDMFDKSLG